MSWKHLFTFLFLTLSSALFAQSALLLVKKQGSAKTARFEIGDDVKVTTPGGNDIKGTLGNITPKALYISGERVPLDSIYTIRRYNFAVISNGLTVSMGGVVFAGIVTVNALINNEELGLEQGSYIVSGAFVAAGLIIARLGYKTYKIEGKRYLEVIDFTRFAEPP